MSRQKSKWRSKFSSFLNFESENMRGKAQASRCRAGIEQLEHRLVLSGNAGLEYFSTTNIASHEQYESFLGSDVNQSGKADGNNGEIGSKLNFQPAEILVGFEGDVVAAHQQRGVEKALQVAAGLVAPFGLSAGTALFAAPAIAGHAARLVTHWSLPASADVMQVITQLTGRPGIAYAEPNGIMTVQAFPPPTDPSFTNPSGWPFGLQEHLPQVDAAQAWDTTLGANVTVAIVDTGVDLDHPDLNGNIKPGTTILKGSTKLGLDDNGHGTHVAGIIAAEINNLTDLAAQASGDNAWQGGTVGMAPQAKIMPVKVLNSGGSGSWADIAKGIDYAANNGANIINMSLGGGFSATVSSAILNAYDKGVLVISAAGNGNAENSGHPASDPYSLSIAAVDSNDVRASFSNYGFSVDVAAPGVNTLSTFIDLDTVGPAESGSLTGAYGRISGTSMATPVAAGLAALIWSKLAAEPGWTSIAPRLKVQSVASQILATADNIDDVNPNFVGKLGAGRIDAAAALGPQVTAPVVIAMGGLGAAGATLSRLEVGQAISIQYSHVMNSASVLNPTNYELLYLGANGEVGGEDDQSIPLSMLSTVYDAFPGRGVQLTVNGQAPDGEYQFRVISGGVEALGGTDLNGDFAQVFSVVPRLISNFQPVEPLGSLVYQARVGDTFNSTGDVDRFTVEIDGSPEQVVSVRVNSAASTTVTMTHSVDGEVSPDGLSGPLPAGTLTIAVTGTATGSYSVDVLLNAVRNSGAAVQALDDTFVTLADEDDFTKLDFTADRAVVLGSFSSYSPGTMIEDWDDGIKAGYIEQSNGKDRTSNTTVIAAAAHDGSHGLADATHFGAGGWLYRTGNLFQRSDTELISVWVRSEGSVSGRGYFGFGSSATGTLSMQMAPNTGQLILGRHSGYNSYEDLAVATQSWQANKWYRFVIDWQNNGDIIGRLYDSDGTTLLNTISANDNTITTSGGIAFRSFDSTKHFDTVQKLTPADTTDEYSFTLATGQTATLVATRLSLAGPAPTIHVDDNPWTGAPISGDGIHHVRVTGGVGTEYSLQILRSAIFDAGSNDSFGTAQPLTQQVALGAIRPIIVGYYTDFNPTSTRPATPILAAGYVPRQITNISTFDLSTIDVLTIYEQDNLGISAALLAQLPAIEAWVSAGGRLTVHDRFVSQDGVANTNPLIVGRPDIQVTREFTTEIDVITTGTLVTDGPDGRIVDDNTLDGGNSSSHGYADTLSLDTPILSFGAGSSSASSFSYELGAGLVYYSTIPLDFYLGGTTPFSTVYAPNTVAYAAEGITADEDWYVITTSGAATIETRTPSDGAGQFANNLDPRLELYDSSNFHQAFGEEFDGRNEILYIPSAGIWYIRVTAESGVGEYILIDPPISMANADAAATLALEDATSAALESHLLSVLAGIEQAPLSTGQSSYQLPGSGTVRLLSSTASNERSQTARLAALQAWNDWDRLTHPATRPSDELQSSFDGEEEPATIDSFNIFFADLANDS